MDLWALNLRTGGPTSFCWRKSRVVSVDDGFSGVAPEIRVFTTRMEKKPFGYRSLQVSATGKKNGPGNSSSSGNNEPSIPDNHDPEGSKSDFDKAKPDDSLLVNLDWRSFRANLVAQEKVLREDSDYSDDHETFYEPSKRIGTKWAHPIAMPEPGCILVATEKLDGVRNFERTVILLLRLGTRDPREGPFGVIINRPLDKKIKHMKRTSSDLATTFANCSLHFGGPLDASMFLLKTDGSSLPSFEQVLPGISFGSRNNIDEAAELVKEGALMPQDLTFFVGYAGWQLDQLIDEIKSDYWVVAACSSDLISSSSPDSSSGLWEEILQLMGGQYSELSRKPREDSS